MGSRNYLQKKKPPLIHDERFKYRRKRHGNIQGNIQVSRKHTKVSPTSSSFVCRNKCSRNRSCSPFTVVPSTFQQIATNTCADPNHYYHPQKERFRFHSISRLYYRYTSWMRFLPSVLLLAIKDDASMGTYTRRYTDSG